MIVYDRKTVTERELYYDRYCMHTHSARMHSAYRIALKFCGSKFSRIAVFENFVDVFSRILKHTITYGRGYFTSCVYVRTRVAYLTRLLLSQMPTFEVEAMVRSYMYRVYQDSIDQRGTCVC